MLKIVFLLGSVHAAQSVLGGRCHQLLESIADEDEVSVAALCRSHLGPKGCHELLQRLGKAPWNDEVREKVCLENADLFEPRGLLDSPLDEVTGTKDPQIAFAAMNAGQQAGSPPASIAPPVLTVPPITVNLPTAAPVPAIQLPNTKSEISFSGIPKSEADKVREKLGQILAPKTTSPTPLSSDMTEVIRSRFTSKDALPNSGGQSQAGSRRQNRVKEDKWWESPEVAQRDPSPEPAQAAQTLDEGRVAPASHRKNQDQAYWMREAKYHPTGSTSDATSGGYDWGNFISSDAKRNPNRGEGKYDWNGDERMYSLPDKVLRRGTDEKTWIGLVWGFGLVALVSLTSSLALRWRQGAPQEAPQAYSRLEAQVAATSSRELRFA